MSIQALAYVLGDKDHPGPDISGATLLCLMCLAHHAGDQADCWPSHGTIARETRLNAQHVRRCLRALKTAGEISIIPNGAPDRRIPPDRRSNLYVLDGYLRSRAAKEDLDTPSTSTPRRECTTRQCTTAGGSEEATKSSKKESFKDHHDDAFLIDAVARVLAGGGQITKPCAYLGRALGRHVAPAEAERIMGAARDRAQEKVEAKGEAAERAEARLATAYERSRAEADRIAADRAAARGAREART